jgi:hypothetical protein
MARSDDAFDRLAELASTATSRRQVMRAAGGAAVASLLPWSRSARARDMRMRRPHAGATGNCPAQASQADQCQGTIDPTLPQTNKLNLNVICEQAGGHTVPNGLPSDYNGCGPDGGVDTKLFGKHDLVPDNPFELGNFYNACKGHDCCYGRCGSAKATCDSNFYNDMVAACQSKWPGDGVLDVAGQYWCEQVARVYYNAVANDPQGTDAYNAGQSFTCACCMDCKNALILGAKYGSDSSPNAVAQAQCEAAYVYACPDGSGGTDCVSGCGDSDNCGGCGLTCPPKDNGDGSSQRGCCWDGACTWEVGCLNYCSCWNIGQSSGG